MRKPALCIIITFLLLTSSVKAVHAKRLLPRFSPTTAQIAGNSALKVAVKFRADRKAIVTTFSNLTTVNNIDYILNYSTIGLTQGASGTIVSSDEDPVIRELLFGTCSHGVCRYDSGITNAKFSVTISYKTGKKVIKNYRLKI